MKVTHAEWQSTIVAGAGVLGWRHMHVRSSIGKGKKWTTATNVDGWPDLWLWHPRHGFAAIEVKVHPDKARPDQLEVLASLAEAGARTLVVFPEDWEKVQAVLRGDD